MQYRDLISAIPRPNLQFEAGLRPAAGDFNRQRQIREPSPSSGTRIAAEAMATCCSTGRRAGAKTTLAAINREGMEGNVHQHLRPVLREGGLTEPHKRGIAPGLFHDEIHG